MKIVTSKHAVILFVLTAITTGAASTARADERIVANVPFAFIVGDMRMPAGKYVVMEVSDGSGVLEVTSVDGRKVVCTLTIPESSDATASQPELIFQKYSDHYFLSRVVPEDGVERKVILTPTIMDQEIVRTSDRSGN